MIPVSVEEKIRDQIKDDGEQRQLFITYYIHYSPYSTSWTLLASELHYKEETTAEAAVKKFVEGTQGVGVACVCVVM